MKVDMAALGYISKWSNRTKEPIYVSVDQQDFKYKMKWTQIFSHFSFETVFNCREQVIILTLSWVFLK